MYVTFQSAMRAIIRAGLASNYQDAAARYSDRLTFVQCNMVTRESVQNLTR